MGVAGHVRGNRTETGEYTNAWISKLPPVTLNPVNILYSLQSSGHSSHIQAENYLSPIVAKNTSPHQNWGSF